MSVSISTEKTTTLWEKCLENLRDEVSGLQFNRWIRPLQAVQQSNELILLAPNRFVLDGVSEHFFQRISALAIEISGKSMQVRLVVGAYPEQVNAASLNNSSVAEVQPSVVSPGIPSSGGTFSAASFLDPNKVFASFVEGKSNQLARAAALRVAEKVSCQLDMGKGSELHFDSQSQAYNPLCFYGGVGLGKTHLTHAIGNAIRQKNHRANIICTSAEDFVVRMIRALQRNQIDEFKNYYRSANVLLIDDIQFFAGKDRSQEEFFHTFNALLDSRQQIVLTCDKYPKEINGLEERLKSRFGWGLTVAIEPPDLETRVAILMNKAEQVDVNLPHEVAFFVAKHIQSNVRELEGALKRVIANAHFTGHAITLDFTREALKDLLTLQAKLISIDNIQKTVAEYYKIKVSDLLSERRNRSLARPRQLAMALAKELTNHSLPEIGDAFKGRDHTTVLHACKRIKELLETALDVQEDYKNLIRILSG